MMNTYFKKISGIFLMLLSFNIPAFADNNNMSSCSNHTLQGTYMFNVSGELFISDEKGYAPETYAALVSYDGNGNLILKKTSSINGVWTTQITQATYQIQSDCSGLAVYPNAKYRYYVAPSGESLTFVKTSNYNGEKFVESQDKISGSVMRVSKHQIKFIESD